MIKVCLFIDKLNNSGGTEKMTVVLADGLVQKGYEVHIITNQGGNESFYILNPKINRHYLFKESGVNIYKTYLKGLVRYKKLINKIKPDYIIDVCVAMSLVTVPATIFNRKVKTISWEHFNANAYFNIVTATISKYMASKIAHSVIVLTDKDKEVYKKKFGAKRIATISNPVTIDVGKKADLDSKYILAIGRLTSQKGFDYLLDAWSIIAKDAPGWKLRIVGDGELKDELFKQRDELDLKESVELLPSTLEISKFYETSSMFVMSSRFEGLPLVLIEARAYGLPIISFDCETGPREIITNEFDGLLIPPADVKLLAEAILKLINEPEKRKYFSQNAAKNSLNYSPEAFFKKWTDILI